MSSTVTLTEKQKEYLEDPEKFEDEHGLESARQYRHRIRKKVNKALDMVLFVLEKGKTRKSPRRNFRERREKDEIKTDEKLARGRREKKLVDFSKVRKLVKKVGQRSEISARLLREAIKEVC